MYIESSVRHEVEIEIGLKILSSGVENVCTLLLKYSLLVNEWTVI